MGDVKEKMKNHQIKMKQEDYCLETCYDDLDDKIQTLLQKKMGDVKEKMKNHQIKMKQEDYCLLVAGTFNCIISLRSCKKVCVVWG